MKKSLISFAGKTVLVTGGTRGIGKAIADLFAGLGCDVIYTGTGKPEVVLRDRRFMKLDLTIDKSIGKFLALLKRIPEIDILVNNAGINIIEPIEDMKKTNWDKIVKVDLTGPMLLMKEVSRIMIKKKKGGRIVNISSIMGIISKPKRDSYSAVKSGLIGLTRAAALDLAPYGILVNALCPGFTSTDLTKSILSKKEIKELSSEIPLGRFATEDEIAEAAVFLCSDLNTYITGQAIVVDGGFTIK